MASHTDICIARFQNAIRYPFNTRCNDIARLGEEYSGKELHHIFPALVDEIFGTSNQTGWGLRSIHKVYQHDDYVILRDFLQPEGPFFKMCYKLMSNNFYLKYEFPLSLLPVNVRKMIEDGVMSSIYTENLKIDPQTGVPTALSLNPFEFYMFHFGYHLVNPMIQLPEDNQDLWETVYQKLCEDYIQYFLRCDHTTVPPLLGYYVSKSPMPLQTTIRPNRTPTLFRQSVLMTQNNTSSSFHSSPMSNQQSNRLEIWRSELVAVVFVDFWLGTNQTIPSMLNSSLTSDRFQSHSVSAMSANNSRLNLSVNDTNHHKYSNVMPYPRLPSAEHILVVRCLLKHMHYFSNTYVGDGTAMDELKRIYLPSNRVKIYKFLRRTFEQAPLGLDNTFRHILEAYLSYIQPWRYLDYPSYMGSNSHRKPHGDGNNVVDPRWLGFLAENLLFYTVMFRQLVHRFSRLDLGTPKNATQLSRLTRVFSQINLSLFLNEIESSLDDTVISSSSFSHKWTAIVRQHIVDLEGPSFIFIPMFGQQMESEVTMFFNYVCEAHKSAKEILDTEEAEKAKNPPSLWTSFKGVFSNPESDLGNYYSYAERQKVIHNLEVTIHELRSIYNMVDFGSVPPPSENADLFDPNHSSSTEYSSFGCFSSPGQQSMNGSMKTSPLLTPQAMRERSKRIRYEGDPDLEAIRSTENTFLVRVLYQIASRINEMYSTQMSSYFHRQDLVGRVTRRILSPPILIREFDKHTPAQRSPRVERVLPPRLSLRPLASHRFLAYYLFFTIAAYFWGFGPLTFTLILFFVWAMTIVAQAVLVPYVPALLRGGRNTNSST